MTNKQDIVDDLFEELPVDRQTIEKVVDHVFRATKQFTDWHRRTKDVLVQSLQENREPQEILNEKYPLPQCI